MKTITIFEKIAPNEVYILYSDSEGLVWVGNKDGNAFVCKTYIKEK